MRPHRQIWDPLAAILDFEFLIEGVLRRKRINFAKIDRSTQKLRISPLSRLCQPFWIPRVAILDFTINVVLQVVPCSRWRASPPGHLSGISDNNNHL